MPNYFIMNDAYHMLYLLYLNNVKQATSHHESGHIKYKIPPYIMIITFIHSNYIIVAHYISFNSEGVKIIFCNWMH